MNYVIVSIYLMLSLSWTGCGLKEDVEAFDNVLIGTWNLTKLNCYDTDLTGTLKESYSINSENISYVFQSVKFTYAAEDSGSCTNSATGSYGVSYSSQAIGKVSLTEVLTTSVCDITITEDNGAGNIDIPFAMSATASNTSNLYWDVTSEILTMQVATGFSGSSGASYCSSSCTCYGTFSNP